MQHVVLPIAAAFTTGVVLSVSANRFAYGALRLDDDDPLHAQLRDIHTANNTRLLEIKIMYTLAVAFWLFLGIGPYTDAPAPKPGAIVDQAPAAPAAPAKK